MVITYYLQKVKNNNSLSLTGPVPLRLASQPKDAPRFLPFRYTFIKRPMSVLAHPLALPAAAHAPTGNV